MISRSVNTVQNVAINFELASLGLRVSAWAIDILIIYIYLILGDQLLESLNLKTSFESFTIGNVILIIPALLYHLVMEIALQGQSIGKKFMGIRVMLTNGNQPSISNYLIRWISRLLEFSIFFGMAMLVYLFLGKGQRLGDVLAGTFVVKTPKQTKLSDTMLGIQNLDYKPIYAQAQQLSEKDIAIINQLYLPFKNQKKYLLLQMLANQIADVLKIKRTQPPAAFINTVVHDYYYYASLEKY